MSGVFIAVPAGVLLWGVLLGWLVSPWLSIFCAVAIVGAAAIYLTREEA